MDESIEDKLKILEESEAAFLNSVEEMINAYDGAIYPLDLLAIAVFNRSISLVAGFYDFVRSCDYVCAFHLIRMQMDNLLRFFAAFIVEKPRDFAVAVLRGQRVKDLRDKTGKKMADAYLKSELSKSIPWVRRLYDETSGYVHLSDKHIFSAIHPSPDDSGNLEIAIGRENQGTPVNLITSAVEAMSQISLELLRYLHGWTWTKDNPDKLEEMKKKGK